MTDEWLVDGLPMAGDWTGTGPCAPAGNANSIVDTITITGSPGAITSVQNDKSLWALVLNDGTPEADFRIDRFDDAGALASSPMTIVRATGVVSFNDPVMLPADPADPLEAATKHYVDSKAAGLTDAPDDGAFYGRKSLTWANPSHSDITDWAAALAPYALLANVPAGGSALPLINGTAAPGAAAAWSHEDHVHPTDTSRYAANNPAGYQTAAQVTASIPVASSTTPAMDGTAAVGTGATWARADHVHPTDTSRAAVAAIPVASSTTPLMDGTAAVGTGATWARADHVHPTDTSLLPRVGVTDGSNAPAGQIGEYVRATGGGGAISNATATSLAILTLTAGDWDVFARVSFAPQTGVSALQALQVAASNVNNAFQGSGDGGCATLLVAPFTVNGTQIINSGMARYSLSATTTIYGVGQCNFTGGSVIANGSITARRAR